MQYCILFFICQEFFSVRDIAFVYTENVLNFSLMTLLTPLRKRFLIAMPLALVAGLICTALASSTNPDIWGTALMWTIITDRILIGMVVGLA